VHLVVAFDANGLPTRIESRSYHPNLGDVVLSTHFAEYQESDGLQLPTSVSTKVDDFTTADLRFTKTVVNAEIDDLAAPASEDSSTASAPAPNVEPEQIAPGVWLLAGQSHHSALIELSDRLLLVDAPQSEARALAVIARARELQPDKPLADLIVTHHHFDHTAGLRAAISEGLRVVTHEGNREFVEEMARRSHTVVADALTKNPRPLVLETFGDEQVVKDSLRTVAMYHVRGNPHSDTMLMVHLPAERVIIEVDAYSPGSAVNPYAANLLENITSRRLRVDRIVPLHGNVAPFSDLTKVGAQQTN
jgi:glyoxylase-like metal-dependent hydrolase (beta-lactamase superfamily II)